MNFLIYEIAEKSIFCARKRLNKLIELVSSMKTALVVESADTLTDIHHYFETVSRNRNACVLKT